MEDGIQSFELLEGFDREAVDEALRSIDPQEIEDRICGLSAVASDIEQIRDDRGQVIEVIEHYPGAEIGRGGSRLAFSEADFHARDEVLSWIDNLVTEAGGELVSIEQSETAVITTYKVNECVLRVEENPAGLIVTYEGLEPSLPGVAVGSHIDTILSAGKEDGQGGVVTGFVVLEAFVRNGIRPLRSLSLLIVTGEDDVELAFSGSKMMAEGVSRAELDTRLKIGFSLREGVARWAVHMEDKYKNHGVKFDTARLMKALERPLLNEGQFGHHLEVHANPVSGGENPVSIVEAVTGALRYRFTLQGNIERQKDYLKAVENFPLDSFLGVQLRIRLTGKGGHVAGRRMRGKDEGDSRHDVLVAANGLIRELVNLGCDPEIHSPIFPTIPNFEIQGASLNSIPGDCVFTVNLFPYLIPELASQEKLNRWIYMVTLSLYNEMLRRQVHLSSRVSFYLEEVDTCLVSKEDWRMQMPLDMFFIMGTNLADAVKVTGEGAEKYAMGEGKESTVATATLSTLEITGPTSVEVGVDLRSSDRDLLVNYIDGIFKMHLTVLIGREESYGLQPLPGSEPPVEMKEEVLQDIERAARFLGLIAPRVTVRAGEDAQVLQKIIKYVCMILYRSIGDCHTPSEDADKNDRAKVTWLAFLAALYWTNQSSKIVN